VNSEFKMVCREVVVVCFEVLSCYLPRKTEGNHRNSASIVRMLAEMQPKHLLHASQQCYHLTQLPVRISNCMRPNMAMSRVDKCFCLSHHSWCVCVCIYCTVNVNIKEKYNKCMGFLTQLCVLCSDLFLHYNLWNMNTLVRSQLCVGCVFQNGVLFTPSVIVIFCI
jgi:hypothetical protein